MIQTTFRLLRVQTKTRQLLATSIVRSLSSDCIKLSHKQNSVSVRYFSNPSSDTKSGDDVSAPSSPLVDKIAVIGAGTMAQAMVEALVRAGIQPGPQFSAFDVSETAMLRMHDSFGVQLSQSITDCLKDASLILMAVKPQNLTDSFFDQMQAASPKDDAIALSVIAGTPLATLRRSGVDKVVRSMPNTPAVIGQGMTVWSCTTNLTTDERQLVRKVLNSFGKAMYVDDEAFIDMATSISGSGPAYIFMLMEAMIDAGVHMGFPRDQATTLVYQTMLGSTLYAMETQEHPAILRNRVTSPRGTTASAIYELENGRFRTVIKDAMWACYRRSLEMGNRDSNVGPHRARDQASPPPR